MSCPARRIVLGEIPRRCGDEPTVCVATCYDCVLTLPRICFLDHPLGQSIEADALLTPDLKGAHLLA